MKAIALCAITLLLTSAAAQAADAPKVEVQPVARVNTTIIGQPIVVPERPDVIVSIATFPPGSRLPEHEHLHPHYVYVLDGVLTVVNTQTNATFDVKAGDFVVEMQDTWHYGINNGTVPVKLLVIDQVPAGDKSNMVPKP
ncbi:MAG: cupin domain-containing protein [Proteobacteria bacterium]|nr:cupin domain-containing protein [Pseudomonadota bacterium]